MNNPLYRIGIVNANEVLGNKIVGDDDEPHVVS